MKYRATTILGVLLVLSFLVLPGASRADSPAAALDGARTAICDEIESLLGQIDDATDGAVPQTDVIRRKLAELLALTAERRSYNDGVENAGRQSARSPEFIRDAYAACAGLSEVALVEKLRELVDGHYSVGYRQAREIMFTQIDNEDGEVECVYTGRRLNVHGQIPSSDDMNCEHTWPQSRGATGIAKTDLHHLFCADSRANSIRSSLYFGEVKKPEWAEGGSSKGNDVFEVRPENRGNTARAILYFALRYRKRVKPSEEEAMRRWHREDPVDEAERARNDAIYEVQRNRNPFVDHPEFVDRISDF